MGVGKGKEIYPLGELEKFVQTPGGGRDGN